MIEAQDPVHVEQIIGDLQNAGFVVRRGAGGVEFD